MWIAFQLMGFRKEWVPWWIAGDGRRWGRS